jgi:hypothetical protein
VLPVSPLAFDDLRRAQREEVVISIKVLEKMRTFVGVLFGFATTSDLRVCDSHAN